MNNGVSYIQVFNQVVDEFFRELMCMFPTENKIKVNHALFQTMCKTNVRKPCNDFMQGVLPYLELIANKDDQLITGNAKPGIIDSNNLDVLWPGMSDNSKKNIWKYIQTFIIIGTKIINVNRDYVPLLEYICNNNF